MPPCLLCFPSFAVLCFAFLRLRYPLCVCQRAVIHIHTISRAKREREEVYLSLLLCSLSLSSFLFFSSLFCLPLFSRSLCKRENEGGGDSREGTRFLNISWNKGTASCLTESRPFARQTVLCPSPPYLFSFLSHFVLLFLRSPFFFSSFFFSISLVTPSFLPLLPSLPLFHFPSKKSRVQISKGKSVCHSIAKEGMGEETNCYPMQTHKHAQQREKEEGGK